MTDAQHWEALAAQLRAALTWLEGREQTPVVRELAAMYREALEARE